MPNNAYERNDSRQIAAQLRLLAARPDNRRRLCALPQFRVETKLPGELERLLGRLDKAEPSGVR